MAAEKPHIADELGPVTCDICGRTGDPMLYVRIRTFGGLAENIWNLKDGDYCVTCILPFHHKPDGFKAI
jgi:hypothetical protein